VNSLYCTEVTGNSATLSTEESMHCIKVLRLKKGDHLIIIDGKGGLYDAVIEIPDPKHCIVNINKTIEHSKNRDAKLHIAIAPTKNPDRFEWFIEKSVEIGVDIITPLLCQRSERTAIKTERINKLIISSIKQAVIPYKPVLNEMIRFGDFVGGISGSPFNRFIAHCLDTDKKQLKDVLSPKTNTIILIGPEGDFTPGEIDMALASNFTPVSLGSNRLRTETAGVVACSIVQIINS